MSRELLKKARDLLSHLYSEHELVAEIEAELDKPNLQSKELFDLFKESLAWGMVYGPVIDPGQWDEMRDSMAKQFSDRAENPYKNIPSHPKFEAFIRAFWRRINAHKNQYDKELPDKIPIEFRASMETALLVFDK